MKKLARIAALRALPGMIVEGIPVAVADFDVSRDQVRSCLDRALEILRTRAPRQYPRIRRYISHIFVWPGHYTAFDKLGGMLLASKLVSECDDAEIVGALVHEAVHLRIVRYGVRYSGRNKARIERRCVLEQIDCLERCELVTSEDAASLIAALSDEWWSDEARRRDVEEVLQRVGLPTWGARLFVR